MKSINYLFFSNYGNIFIFVILAFISSVLCSPPCGLYGAPPCQFLPAPPGHTPSCARPGKTYCEHVDNYPTYLIKHLVHKWGYEAKNLLVDETWEEFSSLSWHDIPHFYDPAYIFPPQRPYGGSGSNSDFNGYKYKTPSNGEVSSGISSSSSAGTGYGGDQTLFISKTHTTEPPTYLLYSSAGQRLNLNKNQVHPYGSNTKVTPNNPTLWLKRIARELSQKYGSGASAGVGGVGGGVSFAPPPSNASLERHTRDVSLNMDLLDIMGVQKGGKSRVKRQSPGRTSLCQTASQFITPQAALNSRGNWMFVVNEANTARQMVKTELCASNTCSNLCQLPNGYNSRCEQKFVQKRLIALQGNGQNLYTDSFWFPSCCVCTISSL